MREYHLQFNKLIKVAKLRELNKKKLFKLLQVWEAETHYQPWTWVSSAPSKDSELIKDVSL